MSANQDGGGFSDSQTRVLDHVLDDIIPPSIDGRLPGAGALGLASIVEAQLRKTPDLHAMIAAGLAALEQLARSRGAQGFAALPASDKAALLAQLAAGEHAFPPLLLVHTFAAYYQHPRVVEALGLQARAPHPEGYAVEPNDLTLLDAVRRRPKMYREC